MKYNFAAILSLLAVTQSINALQIPEQSIQTTLSTVYHSAYSVPSAVIIFPENSDEEDDDELLAELINVPDEDGRMPIGFKYLMNENDQDADPITFIPIFDDEFDTENAENILEKRNPNADADADAWRWHIWFRNQAIYKRAADAEADANALAAASLDADAWRWHSWFKNQSIYKREPGAYHSKFLAWYLRNRYKSFVY